MAGTLYQVFITPLIGADTYGDEIDVSDRIRFDGLGTIKRSIDANDYDIGVFAYDDLQMKGINENGYFNDETDYRSIFTYGRDLAKVRVVFTNSDGDTIVYRGLINEEATRLTPTGDEINFRVLSRDSVIRTTKTSAGVVTAGMTVKAAILAILDIPKITSVLTIDAANINPANNHTIDVGSKFDNKTARENLNKLLLSSNSAMLINDAGEVIIRDRSEDETRDVLNLYGPHDIKMRQNVIRLTAYNTGKHRMFTSVKVNDTEESNAAYVSTFGYRQKKIDLDYITDTDTESEIAAALLEEFKTPKIELNIEVPTYVVRGVELLDRVSVNWPLRLKPVDGTFFPIVGDAVIGDDLTPLPQQFGSIQIPANFGFKVIEITENPKDFETILKLRQIGTDINDGVLNMPGTCVLGFAIIGEAVICDGGSECDTYNPSVVGAAVTGCTLVA